MSERERERERDRERDRDHTVISIIFISSLSLYTCMQETTTQQHSNCSKLIIPAKGIFA